MDTKPLQSTHCCPRRLRNLFWTHTFHSGGHSPFQQWRSSGNAHLSRHFHSRLLPQHCLRRPHCQPQLPASHPGAGSSHTAAPDNLCLQSQLRGTLHAANESRSRIPIGEEHGSYHFLSRRTWCPPPAHPRYQLGRRGSSHHWHRRNHHSFELSPVSEPNPRT